MNPMERFPIKIQLIYGTNHLSFIGELGGHPLHGCCKFMWLNSHVIAIKEKRAVGARKKLGFGGTWSILEQVKGRGPGRGRGGGVGWGGVFLSAGDLEPFFKNFWGSEPYGATQAEALQRIEDALDSEKVRRE